MSTENLIKDRSKPVKYFFHLIAIGVATIIWVLRSLNVHFKANLFVIREGVLQGDLPCCHQTYRATPPNRTCSTYLRHKYIIYISLAIQKRKCI